MAGSLIKIDEYTVPTATSSIIIGGGSSGSSGLNASIDSTYDVYMLRANKITSTTDNGSIRARVTVGGTPQTGANYENAYKLLNTAGSFSNQYNSGMTSWEFAGGTGTGTGETVQNILYLYQFNNASSFTFISWENNTFNHQPFLYGANGCQQHSITQSCDGINFFGATGNIAAGAHFVLYGLKKS